ncbi:LIM domain-containing protein pin-2 [Striga asiatica]|uniref:LIM domain-containing protein pin-2 n=1 Tax=Striga asiatica TaxID=4170 RepID=A0A5A7QA08_STRAF|nr:LIM domain-containing protein pin-2 [Striga asiatica]
MNPNLVHTAQRCLPQKSLLQIIRHDSSQNKSPQHQNILPCAHQTRSAHCGGEFSGQRDDFGKRVDRNGAAQPSGEDRPPFRLQVGFECGDGGEFDQRREATAGFGGARRECGEWFDGETNRTAAGVQYLAMAECGDFEVEVKEGRGSRGRIWRNFYNKNRVYNKSHFSLSFLVMAKIEPATATTIPVITNTIQYSGLLTQSAEIESAKKSFSEHGFNSLSTSTAGNPSELIFGLHHSNNTFNITRFLSANCHIMQISQFQQHKLPITCNVSSFVERLHNYFRSLRAMPANYTKIMYFRAFIKAKARTERTISVEVEENVRESNIQMIQMPIREP